MDEMTRRQLVSSAATAGAVGLTVIATPTSAAEQNVENAQVRQGSEFIVKLNGIKLPPEAEARIAAEIQTAVMRGLASSDFRTVGLTFSIPDPGWLGYWVERLAQHEIPVLRAQQVERR